MKKSKIYLLAAASLLSIGMLTACSTNSSKDANTEQVSSKKNVANDHSFLLGEGGVKPANTKTSDKAVMDVYFDPLCPGCAEFERTTSDYLLEKVNSGKLIIRYHPLMFLDSSSNGDKYSSRTSAYILGMAEYSPKTVSKFMKAIFAEDFYPTEDNYKKTSTEKLDELFTKLGGTEAQKEKIHNDLQVNMKNSYEATLAVMKSSDLKSKSLTGELFTPFVLPNKPGKTDAKALMFSADDDGMIKTTKEAVEKILK